MLLWILKALKSTSTCWPGLLLIRELPLTFSLWARAEPVNYQYSPPAWINSSGQEESSIQKLKERVAWLSKSNAVSLWGLLSRLMQDSRALVEVNTAGCPHPAAWNSPVDSGLITAWDKLIGAGPSLCHIIQNSRRVARLIESSPGDKMV